MNHLSDLPMQYLNPHTAPVWVAAIVVALALYLCFRLGRMIVRTMRAVKSKRKELANSDSAYLQAMARHHAKLHENDGRSF